MKKSNILSLALVTVAALSFAQLAQAATQTYEGVVSDAMCGKKHMMPGKSNAQCIQECAKAGSKYVLVAGQKIYTLEAKAQLLAPLADKHVQITGELKDTTLSVQSVHESSKR